MIPHPVKSVLALALALPLEAGPVAAQEAAKPVLGIELNALAQTDTGCRLTFVVNNGFAADLTKAVFEFALFNKAGLVERLLTLDFKELPKGRTRVRQFDLADLQCAGLARILVNDARECAGGGIEPAACMSDLETSTSSDVKFGS